jgi:hypothetical protein
MTQPSQKKPRRTFIPEFKLDIVRQANTPKASISSIALEQNSIALQPAIPICAKALVGWSGPVFVLQTVGARPVYLAKCN